MRRTTVRIGTALLALVSIGWHLREIGRLAAVSAPRFPFATTAAAFASSMLAAWAWFGGTRES